MAISPDDAEYANYFKDQLRRDAESDYRFEMQRLRENSWLWAFMACFGGTLLVALLYVWIVACLRDVVFFWNSVAVLAGIGVVVGVRYAFLWRNQRLLDEKYARRFMTED